MKRVVLVALLTAASPVLAKEPVSYRPHPVKIDPAAGYLDQSGTVTIVGNDGMASILTPLTALFQQAHPELRFRLVLEGSSTAVPALMSGVTPFAPMTRSMWDGDLRGFQQRHGYLPQAINIGWAGYGPRPGRKNPPAAYVHVDNPITGLTMEQLSRLFTRGSPKGDITQWSQLGLRDDWVDHAVHLYGLADDGGAATSLRKVSLGGRQYALRYEALPNREAILRAVAGDRYGIGLVGWADPAKVTDKVKVLPLSAAQSGPFYGPGREEVQVGLYPLASNIRIFVDRAPGMPVDSLSREYVRLALSREGQAIIESLSEDDEGYLPLSQKQVEQELKKLD